MNLFAAIRKGIEHSAAQPAPERRAPPQRSQRALAGGRVSLDSNNRTDLFTSWRGVLAPESPDETWRFQSLDADTLDRLSPARLAELLSDLSPEISRALWDFHRMCNPGWECKAYTIGGEDTIDNVAQTAADAFLAQLNGYYGAADSQINRLFMSAFLRGALCAELVLDAAGRMPVDLAIIDPYVVGFRRKDDEVRGPIWQLCQQQNSQVVDLDRPTILYIPVDPLPGKPYGRALVTPALFTAVFGLAMLHDIRRVVQQQGWPRIDLEIDLEQLMLMLSTEEQGNPDQLGAAVAQAVADIQTVYEGLEPDDAYVHPSAVSVNRPVGTVDASSLGAVDGLIGALDRYATRALKSNPLLMGLDMNASEGQANRLWETHAAGVKSIQHLAETMLERLITLGLQAQGIVARVEFRFAELRTAELLRDAQVAQIQMTNARMAYDNGLISQDEQAEMALGKATADVPEPRTAAAKGGTVVGGQPDPGSARIVDLTRNGHEVTNGKH